MADPLMTIDQYEARLGRPLSGAKRAQAEAFLADASDVVRRLADGRLDDVAPEEVSGAIRMVLFSMVTRARTNPNGYSSERIADYQYSGAGSVYATDEEKDQIRDDVEISAVRVVQLTGDMPQRLLDEASAVPYTPYYLGGY
mgnify:CR=1 FL=1